MAIFKKPVSVRKSIKKTSRKAKSPYGRHSFKAPRPMSRGTGGSLVAGRITGIGNSDFGFPDKLKTKLIYADVVQLNSTLGTVATYSFRMNSLFDPDLTGTGHQPQWYDQMTSVYLNYRVLGSKITCRFVPTKIADTEANDSGPFIVGVTGSAVTPLSASSYATLLENGNSNNDIIVDKQGSKNCATVCQTFSGFRDLGLDPYDDRLSAGFANNPSAVYYAHLWAQDMNEASATDISVQIQIEYQVEFYNRKEGVLS